MTVSLRLAPEEATLFRDYAKLHGRTLSEIFREVLKEKIAEEFELAVVKDYEKKKKNGTLKLIDSKKVWESLGL